MLCYRHDGQKEGNMNTNKIIEYIGTLVGGLLVAGSICGFVWVLGYALHAAIPSCF